MIPEERELLPYPCHGFRAVVLPHNFIVCRQRASGFVHAPDKRRCASVGIRNHARLAVHEAVYLIRNDANFHFAGREQVIQPPQAFGVGGRRKRLLRLTVAPFRFHAALGEGRDFHVVRAHAAVTYDADFVAHLFQRFPGDFQRGRGEITRDTVIGNRAL